MGKKRGKGARKRRREESEVDVASLASKLIKSSTKNNDIASDDDDGSSAQNNNAQHGISDASLETTVATLQKLCGLVDTETGKLALKDKRYRNLRKVVYELQSSTGGGCGVVQTSNNTLSLNDVSNNNGKSTNNTATTIISSSKITREISAQIENGCWELAINTLRNVRKKQEEYNATAKKQAVEKSTNTNTDANYLRPKLGSVQRWVRQIDAAGTNDPLAIGVLDAILRLVAPEAILPVDKVDMDKATWTKLGVNSSSLDNGNGKHEKSGSVRIFPPVDRRRHNYHEEISMMPHIGRKYEFPLLDNLVRCMKIGEDGIRIIPAVNNDAVHTSRAILFRQCGFEKGKDRRPPNKYDLELVTTSDTTETKYLDGGDPPDTVEGHHILPKEYEPFCPIVKTSLPYVQDSFLLENILSMKECDRLIAAAESAGYHPDEPLAGQPGESILAHACVWVVDHTLERRLFERVKDFLPTYEQEGKGGEVETLQPLGLNRRFRFYRYVPGRYYRPHIDGAWPSSGFDGQGNYRYDICDEANKNGLQFVEKEEDPSNKVEAAENEDSKQSSDIDKEENMNSNATINTRRQMSRLTFLIYLNEDFVGGETTFLVPAKEKEGTLNAFPVTPVRGGILVFPHGTCNAPLHEGSPVLKRCKYVVRTEVEYYV